ISKIDEANKQATRLSQMLFGYNRALWALLANAEDKAGRPLPAPHLGEGGQASDTLDVDDDSLLRLPGMSDIKSLVAPIDYKAALDVLRDHMAEIKADLPELAYFQLREQGELS